MQAATIIVPTCFRYAICLISCLTLSRHLVDVKGAHPNSVNRSRQEEPVAFVNVISDGFTNFVQRAQVDARQRQPDGRAPEFAPVTETRRRRAPGEMTLAQASDGIVVAVESGIPAIAEYIRALAQSLDSTTHAGDRSMYQTHLASAARLVALIDEGADDVDVRRWFDAEQHGHGWSYLSGDEGEAAEAAFVVLKTQLLGDAP
jgi:hypothetical protein